MSIVRMPALRRVFFLGVLGWGRGIYRHVFAGDAPFACGCVLSALAADSEVDFFSESSEWPDQLFPERTNGEEQAGTVATPQASAMS